MSNQTNFDFDGDGIMSETEQKHMLERIKARRSVALWTFAAIVVATFAIIGVATGGLLTVELLSALTPILAWFYGGGFGIIAAWYGAEAFGPAKR